MLHIATPLYRYEYLNDIYNSIPPHNDITWHISKTSDSPKLKNDFLNDPRVKIYEIDCSNKDTVSKRNVMFDKIKKDSDGYFYLLDDDTLFLNQTYQVYLTLKNENFKGMVVGNRLLNKNSKVYIKAQMPNTDPSKTKIDTGMVICHNCTLEKVCWVKVPEDAGYGNDSLFWSSCYTIFGNANTKTINQSICLYNHFGPKIKVRKSFFGSDINFNIYNTYLAYLYTVLSTPATYFRNIFGLKRINKFPYYE